MTRRRHNGRLRPLEDGRARLRRDRQRREQERQRVARERKP